MRAAQHQLLLLRVVHRVLVPAGNHFFGLVVPDTPKELIADVLKKQRFLSYDCSGRTQPLTVSPVACRDSNRGRGLGRAPAADSVDALTHVVADDVQGSPARHAPHLQLVLNVVPLELQVVDVRYNLLQQVLLLAGIRRRPSDARVRNNQGWAIRICSIILLYFTGPPGPMTNAHRRPPNVLANLGKKYHTNKRSGVGCTTRSPSAGSAPDGDTAPPPPQTDTQ
eukprot:1178164-Prorocentrum_minimum.AAC.3